MAEQTILVCDVCGAEAAKSVTIRVDSRGFVKDYCETHLTELLSRARRPRPGRRPGATAKASAPAKASASAKSDAKSKRRTRRKSSSRSEAMKRAWARRRAAQAEGGGGQG